ncbi:internal virion protein C [Pectobacterium phage PP47]|uniref:Internal virion protein C n=1 Tax=Pectobacterium phage PP47 TaxID=1932882 RepID=A0A1P8L698_9CAUD|nr:internal virion protein [Pectobacterium phage PP47]APW79782.1 internal virion protein C [Pectobacterium phage PP47]
MASALQNALQGSVPAQGSTRLRGARQPAQGYQAAQVSVEKPQSGLLDSMMKFAETSANAYGTWAERNDKELKKSGTALAEEIFGKYDPAEIKRLTDDGTILHQDNPYVQKQLRQMAGKQTAYMADNDAIAELSVNDKMTRAEFIKFRQERVAVHSKEQAEAYGWNEQDEDYKLGFYGDAVERNIAVHRAYDQQQDQRSRNAAKSASFVELSNVTDNGNLLADPKAGADQFVAVARSQSSNGLVNDSDQVKVMQMQLEKAVNTKGSAPWLNEMRTRKFTVDGVEQYFEDIYGREQFDTWVTKAESNTIQKDAEDFAAFTLRVNEASNAATASDMWNQAIAIEAELNKMQPSGLNTPERQQVVNLKKAAQDALGEERKKAVKDAEKVVQRTNKNALFDAAMVKRMNGEAVSLDASMMPETPNTGTIEQQDLVNWAQDAILKIDKMNLPDAKKDELRMKYLQYDSSDGVFTKVYGEQMQRAQSQWAAAVITGKWPESTEWALANRMYQQDPVTMAMRFPEMTELMALNDAATKFGIPQDKILASYQANQGKTKEDRDRDSQQWLALKNDNKYPNLVNIPPALEKGARVYYDSWVNGTGDSNTAAKMTSEWLSANNVSFSKTSGAANRSTDSWGTIPKASLMVTDDTKSYEQGAKFAEHLRDTIMKENPAAGNVMFWQDLNGDMHMQSQDMSVNKTFNNAEFRVEYQKFYDETVVQPQRKANKEKMDKGLKDINKRLGDNIDTTDKEKLRGAQFSSD